MERLNSQEVFGFNPGFDIYRSNTISNLVPEIDPNYKFNPQATKAILAGFMYNKKVQIIGLHGSGKSTHIEQVAARLNWPVVRVNLDGFITRVELIGRDSIILKENKQVIEFHEGVLPWAVREGIALILDEYDAARPEVLFILQQLLEAEGRLFLHESNSVIPPHQNFRLFATSNTAGIGDQYGIYHGTQYLNQGQLDRWNLIARLDYLEPEDEISIILAKTAGKISENIISQMVSFAGLCRDGFRMGLISQVMSLRTVIIWAENFLIFPSIQESLYLSFLNRCSNDELEIYVEYYQRVFNEDLKPVI